MKRNYDIVLIDAIPKSSAMKKQGIVSFIGEKIQLFDDFAPANKMEA